MQLILYSKPGCHLCEGLQEKLEQIPNLSLELEVRDITTREDWFLAYQYEVPVLYLAHHRGPEDTENEVIEERLPRPSPRASVQQLAQMLAKYLTN
ncbi:MAG: glutaredoxin family protein [Nostoc sp. LLA-1]|nr:glutaredoxin family protein [Cyanocohniella sp. LLY]